MVRARGTSRPFGCRRPALLAACWLAIGLLGKAPVAVAGPDPDPAEMDIIALQVAMGSGRLTARELVDYYLARIERLDRTGPTLNAIKVVNADALRIADALDGERRAKGPRGLLHGIPVIVKDNFQTEGMPTTAGSVLLEGFVPTPDAFQVAKLKAAGAIILGKANMHEFAYGITTVGSAFGATRNPYALDRNPGGSSGGTAAAVAANLATVGMGSDTCGSIRIPAAHNNLVGLRGTQGLASRSGIVPLSHTQDIGGPLARSVTDLALVLDATVGFDPNDPQTALGRSRRPESYFQALRPSALKGARIGVLEELLLVDPEDREVVGVFGRAIAELTAAGASLERIRAPQLVEHMNSRLDGFFVLTHDFKTDINAYLGRFDAAPVRSLEEILRAGQHHPAIDESLRMSAAMDESSESDYLAELAQRQEFRSAVLAVMAAGNLDALAYPSVRRKAAPLGEDQPGSNCRLAANTGLPAISVPAGFTADGLPVGLELLGPPWSEGSLLALAYAYEQATGHRRAPPLPAPDTPRARESRELRQN